MTVYAETLKKKKNSFSSISFVPYHKAVIVHIFFRPLIHMHKHAGFMVFIFGWVTPPPSPLCQSEWQLLEGCDSVVMNV